MVPGVMFKTVSEACNLACDYCYYSRTKGVHGAAQAIDMNLLETFMSDYMLHTRGSASLSWQGGEPLLAGLEFFEHVVQLEGQYAPNHTVISNGIQTNGLLINDVWAEFFHTYNFLVGVSLDGPETIHDARRVDRGGHGSFRRVMRGIDHLRRHNVDFNILTVVHPGNVDRVDALFEFYQRAGLKWVQFIPAMNFMAQNPHHPGRYEITPEEFGGFLCRTFDHWFNDGTPSFSIRFFDNVLSRYAGLEPEQCTLAEVCPPTLVIEQNGDVYPCDFYLSSQWRMGNIRNDRLETLLNSPVYRRFRQLKPSLSTLCQSCQWRSACQGGCPRNRGDDSNLMDVDYFCEAYQQFFAYAEKHLQGLGQRLRQKLVSDDPVGWTGGDT